MTTFDAPAKAGCASTFTGGRPIVVLTPHPDDESIGCGALLAACFATTGAHIVCITDGRKSHPRSLTWPGDALACLRERELIAAVRQLAGRARDVTFLRYPDGHAPLDGTEQRRAAERIAALCQAVGAATLLSASPLDDHCDHQATAKMARLVVLQRPDIRLFYYPVWSRWLDPSLSGSGAVGRLRLFESARWRARKAAAIFAHRSQHGFVVPDDPDGFVLERSFVSFFVRHDEPYLEASA